MVWLYDGDLLHYASSHNFTASVLDQINKSYPKRPDRSLAAGRAILDGKIAHVPDMLADPAYAHELAVAGNWRASIAVPMLRDGRPVGDLTSAGYGHSVGASVGLGYVRREDGAAIDAVWLDGGKFEVDLAGTRLRAKVSLRCPFDPTGARIKG